MLIALAITFLCAPVLYGQGADQLMPTKKHGPFRLHVTGWDVLAWGLDGVSGTMWGAHEAYQADPYVFERAGLDGDFWAHDAWLNKYRGRTVDGGMKRGLFGHTFRDVDHFTGTGSAFVFGTATVTICLQGKKGGNWKAKLAKSAVGYVVRSGAAALTYKALRR